MGCFARRFGSGGCQNQPNNVTVFDRDKEKLLLLGESSFFLAFTSVCKNTPVTLRLYYVYAGGMPAADFRISGLKLSLKKGGAGNPFGLPADYEKNLSNVFFGWCISFTDSSIKNKYEMRLASL